MRLVLSFALLVVFRDVVGLALGDVGGVALGRMMMMMIMVMMMIIMIIFNFVKYLVWYSWMNEVWHWESS